MREENLDDGNQRNENLDDGNRMKENPDDKNWGKDPQTLLEILKEAPHAPRQEVGFFSDLTENGTNEQALSRT